MVNTKKKLCFVTVRYGKDIIGGAEQCCRQFAEHLSKDFDVTVLTSTAYSYIRWEPYYDQGEEIINGVKVLRFDAEEYKDEKFQYLYGKFLKNKKGTKSKRFFKKFINTRGPVCPGLLKYLKNHKNDYDYFLFIPYNYWTSAHCLNSVKNKSILMSCCHDEPPIYMHYDELFSNASKMWYNTLEEQEFVNTRFPKTKNTPSIIPGIGFDYPNENPENEARNEIKDIANNKYILYVGRIDPAKGCLDLIKYFKSYKKSVKNDLKLVLCGAVYYPSIYQHSSKDIIFTGSVSSAEKDLLMRNSIALVNPSPFESFSMVIIESFTNYSPVIVNGKCPVLKGHCVRSNGGFYYENFNEFASEIDLLYNDKVLRDKMGQNGYRYAVENYSWESIIKKTTEFLKK